MVSYNSLLKENCSRVLGHFFSVFLFSGVRVSASPDSSGKYSAGSWRIVLIITGVLIGVVAIVIISAALVAHREKKKGVDSSSLSSSRDSTNDTSREKGRGTNRD
ncbi:uncharacterized protein LOC134854910 [Symsagittifera roscoffensis]|uniref:uncharacterized protein LOC134854910 n=1 Tax=Symsagittifera roscoffensis TaxID=84072 RepID=UPI00307C418A